MTVEGGAAKRRAAPAYHAALLLVAILIVATDALEAAGSDPATALVARGRYLAHGVCECFECHSPLQPGGLEVPIANRLGAGDILDEKLRQVAPNITPDPDTGAGRWTDDQLIRAIRDGIGHDGRRLSLAMPYHYFSVMTDDDVRAIVAYLRSLPLAGPSPGARTRPGSFVVSPNITADPSGIAYYDAEIFIKTIRTGRVAGIRPLTRAMPWFEYRKMTDQDLGAIFLYLRSVPPVRHRVNNTDPPTWCARCGRAHGLGDLNRP